MTFPSEQSTADLTEVPGSESTTLDAFGLANGPMLVGPVLASAVGSTGATSAQVQQALGLSSNTYTGAGVRVGVLSDSFNNLGGAAQDEASGALPPASQVQVIKDLASGGSDEGRAMMQIVHDIAPAASLAFYTAFNSEADFAAGILALAAAGCKVICDDVSYFDEPFFQNGIVAQAIETVEAEGVVYLTAAGNNASNGYQAAWTPISGTYDGVALRNTQSFGGSLVQTITIGGNSLYQAPLLLEWDQPYGRATSNLEILVFQNGRLVGTATNSSVGEPTNPWTGLYLRGGQTYQIAIENLSGPNPGLIKEIVAGNGLPVSLSGANAGTTSGHAITPDAITVGAVSAAMTPAFGVSPAIAESFSSSGAGSILLFDDHGNRLATPDLLNPVDVSGIDDIHTTVAGGLSDFYGTSAATPSIAGIVALMLQANPNLTPAQVDAFLESSALAMPNAAVSGAGLAQASIAIGLTLNGVLIQTDGGTSLTLVANQFYYLLNGSGLGPSLKYGGANVIAGNWAPWAPIGAVQTATGYDVAWKSSSGQYSVWATNSNGNYVSNLIVVAPATSAALQLLEPTFGQDLNGDGAIGATKQVIQTDGPTSLTLVAGQTYYLLNSSSGSGPSLQYNGVDVMAGNWGPWVPIGAVQTATGYDVAWKSSNGQYSVWATNNNGNYVSNLIVVAPGTSAALELLEPTFGQDLNSDGVVGATRQVIQTDGSTSLTLFAGQTYYLLNSTSGSGPSLKFGGVDVIASQWNPWAPIGAVQTATGYDVAWSASNGQYSVWATDNNGNYVSNVIMVAPGASMALEGLESTFGQDLNSDGVIGITKQVIQTDGSTSLTLVGGENYYLLNSSNGSGPSLKYGGTEVIAGNWSPWAAIGAVQTASGYDVAWKTSSGQYSVWATDSNGNYVSNLIGVEFGTNAALEGLEHTFGQDLNSDGVIGIPGTGSAPVGSVISIGSVTFTGAVTLGYPADSGISLVAAPLNAASPATELAVLTQYMAASAGAATTDQGGLLVAEPPSSPQLLLTQPH